MDATKRQFRHLRQQFEPGTRPIRPVRFSVHAEPVLHLDERLAASLRPRQIIPCGSEAGRPDAFQSAPALAQGSQLERWLHEERGEGETGKVDQESVGRIEHGCIRRDGPKTGRGGR